MHGKGLHRYIDLNIGPCCDQSCKQTDLRHFPGCQRLRTGHF